MADPMYSLFQSSISSFTPSDIQLLEQYMPWNESEFNELDGIAPHISIPVPAKRPTANHQSPIYGNANLNNQGAANRGSIDLDISPTQRSQARKNYPLDQCKVANSE